MSFLYKNVQTLIFCRNMSRSTNLNRRVRRSGLKNNAGVGHRLKIMSEDSPDLSQLTLDEDSFENMESDLMNSQDMVQFHKQQILKMRKKIDHDIIERKYFERTKFPNLLTWAEKEQIKLLHQKDPELWTAEKLSKSFPAFPITIKKLLKSVWKPQAAERILKHDKSVSENWKLLKKGELDISSQDREYFMKFLTREKQYSRSSDIDLLESQTPTNMVQGEFAMIVTGKLEQASSETHTEGNHSRQNRKISNRLVLRSDLKDLPNSYPATVSSLIEDNAEYLSVTPQLDEEREKKIEAWKPPVEQIRPVPGKRTREPQRVHDCFYSSDGKFLFRVPGGFR